MVQGVYLVERLRMADKTLTMGSLAALAKVNRETIRFYQRTGLLSDTHRTTGGYRQFSQADLKRVIFIRRAKELGFSLSEIRELLAVADGEVVKCGDVRKIAEHVLDSIESRLTQLERLRKILGALVRQCRSAKRISGCPIINELSKGV